MKRMIALLLSVALMLTTLPCIADEYPHDAYEWGSLEMLRQYMCRGYVQFTMESFFDNAGGSELLGIPEYDCTDFPVGIIMDRDHRAVSIKGNNEILHLYLWEEADLDEALQVLAGFAYFQACYCASDNAPCAYELMNGEFRELTEEETATLWAYAYLNQLDSFGALSWSSLPRHNEPIDDAIGRIRTIWTVVGGLKMKYGDELILATIPDTVLFFDEKDTIVIQSQQSTYVITYENSENTLESIKGYVLFHLLMAGCEYVDMQVYSVKETEDGLELTEMDVSALSDLEEAFVEYVGW